MHKQSKTFVHIIASLNKQYKIDILRVEFPAKFFVIYKLY